MASNGVKPTGGRLGRLAHKARRGLEILRPTSYIFVLSHMRCYTTLLCHILNSNPEVSGYVELHRSYVRRRDLLQLKRQVFLGTDAELGGHYVLDKVLHNRSVISPEILRRADVYVIFSLREPRRTIQSTVAMARSLNPKDWKANAAKVTQLYVKRVTQLRVLAYQEMRHAVFIDAQRMIDDTPGVLTELTGFLSLKEPLTEQYQTSGLTGVGVYGDPSEYIQTGRVVRNRADYSDIELSDAELAPAVEAYQSALEALNTLQ